MRSFVLFLALVLGHCVSAQSSPQAPAASAPCPLVVPNHINPNMEVFPAVSCECPITAFHMKVYSRWGMEVLVLEDPERFPAALLENKKLEAGTYFWTVKYTTEFERTQLPGEAQGHITLIK